MQHLMKRFIWASTIILLIAQATEAASPYKKTLSVKKNNYSADGVFIGGKAGAGTTLLNVRRIFSPKAQVERLVLDLGDKDAKPSGKEIGYFQVSMDSAQNRAVIDLAQLKLSRVSETAVRNLFKKSPYVETVNLTLDPEDKAGTMVVQFKKPMKMEVFQQLKSGHPGRVVIDFTPKGKSIQR